MESNIVVLREDQLDDIYGGVLANVAGAVAGAIGGFFGSIIGGDQETDGEDILIGTIAGAAAGAVNPVRGIGSLVTTVGGGVVSGAITSTGNDLREKYRQ